MISKYYEYGNSRNIVISSSSLKHIDVNEDGHPLTFMKYLENKLEKKDSKSLENGTIIHAYNENPEDFLINDVNKPTTQLQLDMIHYMYKRGYTSNDYFDILEEAARAAGYKNKPKDLDFNQLGYLDFLHQEKEFNESGYIITEKQKETILNCIDSINNNQTVQDELALINTENGEIKTYKEIWINFKILVKDVETIDEFTGQITNSDVILNCKALLDHLEIHYGFRMFKINDLKTCYNINKYEKSFIKYKTYRQLAFYRKAVIALLQGKAEAFDKEGNRLEIRKADKPFKSYCHIIAIETDNNYISRVYPVQKEWIDKGNQEIEKLTGDIAWHISNNEWSEIKQVIKSKGLCYLNDPFDYKEEINNIKKTLENYKYRLMRNGK